MTDLQQQRLDRCIAYLQPIAKQADDECGEVHWIAARNADPNQGPSYCRECCDELVGQMNDANPDHEYLRDGGWGYDGSHFECCDKCGKNLRVNLDDCGVEQAIEDYGHRRLRLHGKHATYQAHDLLCVLECAFMGDVDECPWLRGYQAERAKANQAGVHRLTRRIDAIRARATKEGDTHADR